MVRRGELGERKAMVPQRVGSCFHGEDRERKRKGGESAVCWDHTRKAFPLKVAGDSFHNLAIVESTAINIGVHVPLCISTPVSLG